MELTNKAHTPHMFNTIASRYDLVNRVLSLGLDRSWRKQLIGILPKHGDLVALDVAAGTGDQTIALLKSPKITSVVALDPSENMLRIAKKKVAYTNIRKSVEFEIAHAEQMPFLDGAFDVITMSFGIRNVPDPKQALKEMYRVLKPAGHIYILEFSLPENPIFRFGHGLYLRYIVPFVGGSLTGSRSAYRYLYKSIQSFPDGSAFCHTLHDAGFSSATHIPLWFGIVTIYVAKR